MLEALYKNPKSAVLMNNQIGEFFETTVGVRQGCIISPMLFNVYLENIMQEVITYPSISLVIPTRNEASRCAIPMAAAPACAANCSRQTRQNHYPLSPPTIFKDQQICFSFLQTLPINKREPYQSPLPITGKDIHEVLLAYHHKVGRLFVR